MRALLLLFFASTMLWSLSIDEAITHAMKHAPAIHKAQSDLRYAQSSQREARSAFLPTLDAGFNWQATDKTTAFGFSPSHRFNLSAKYNLFNGFADKANVNIKALESAAQRLLLSAQKADLKLDIIRAYTACLKAQKAIETQQDALDSLNRSYSDTNIRYEQGMVAKNELLLIDVQRLRAEQSLVVAKSDRVRSRNHLGRVIGAPLGSDENIQDFTVAVSPPTDFDILIKNTYTHRSELKALYKLRDALTTQHTAMKGNFYPRVDLSADYILNDKERYSGTALVQVKNQMQTMVNVTWNLYNGHADEARRRGVMERVHAQEADITAMKLDLNYQLRDAYEAYHVFKSAKDVAKRAKESAEENYRITKDRYEYGQIDTLTMLTAQSDLTAARNAYNNADYDLYAASAAIERISGE